MRKIVIIGGVAAGLKSASKVRRCDQTAKITVVEKGEIISYGACGMPYYVGGDVAELDELMKTPVGVVRNPGFFKNVKDIEVRVKTEAIAIDRIGKTVTVRNLDSDVTEELPYDKLVIATGATPVRPPLPGVELPNIHQLWHPDDAKAVRKGLEEKKFKSAVIIGAGLVGMEMAEALHNQQVPVTVIEMKNQPFPAFLDPEVGALVAKHLEEIGITLLTGEKVLRFTGEKAVETVETDQRSIPADLVILAIGARPNIKLAKEAGIMIGETGAIAVDEELRTNDPDIYAGGDCVENVHMISGKKIFAPMGSTANKQGRIIGENICGANLKFKGVLATAVAKVDSLNVGKTGLTEAEAKSLGHEYVTALVAGHDKPHYMPGAKLINVKLIVDAKNKKILGMQAVGEGDVSKRVDVVASVLALGGTIDDLFSIDLSYAPPYNSPIDNVVVASNAVMNKLAGRMRGIASIEAAEKMKNGEAVFLDVRSPEECCQIKLSDCNGIKYIPLGQLRKRLSELNKDEEIIAFCKISLRGYEAECILEGEGFENVKVLEGGVAAWPFACVKEEGK